MSGGPEDKQAILREILPADVVVVTDDAVIALAGATAGEPGIVTIAGTGSIAFGRNAAGRTARIGGWGYIFGDEGGGFDIARQALRAALRAEEGWGPPTALWPRAAPTPPAARMPTAPCIFSIRRTGRARGSRRWRRWWTKPPWRAMRWRATSCTMRRSNSPCSLRRSASQLWKPGEPARVAWTGGVFRSRMLLERYRCLVELEDGNRTGPPEYNPAAGALLEAYRAAGLQPRLSGVPALK